MSVPIPGETPMYRVETMHDRAITLVAPEHVRPGNLQPDPNMTPVAKQNYVELARDIYTRFATPADLQ